MPWYIKCLIGGRRGTSGGRGPQSTSLVQVPLTDDFARGAPASLEGKPAAPAPLPFHSPLFPADRARQIQVSLQGPHCARAARASGGQWRRAAQLRCVPIAGREGRTTVSVSSEHPGALRKRLSGSNSVRGAHPHRILPQPKAVCDGVKGGEASAWLQDTPSEAACAPQVNAGKGACR